MIDATFRELYDVLMKYKFMAQAKSSLGRKPAIRRVKQLLASGTPLLPNIYRDGYARPLNEQLESVFSRLSTIIGLDVDALEAVTGCVYQHGNVKVRPALTRFLAVISNMYRSFLDSAKRGRLHIELSETLPPLAVFQSDPRNGPFTLPYENIESLTGSHVGVVSLPHTFADHPFLYGSLAHETGGHDVIHADLTLMPQLRSKVHELFNDTDMPWLGVLWDYWMDEAAADVYGVLNMGPSYGTSLAMLLSIFIAQQTIPKPTAPSLRTASNADEQGNMDVHPTDILRLALVQGVIDSLTQLSPTTRSAYTEQISRISESLIVTPQGTRKTTIELVGIVRTKNGRSINFEQSVPLDSMQEAARKVGAMIATARFDALDGHSIQDIETWDDGDENTAVTIAGRLHAGASIVGAGDDAQVIAGLTMAVLQQPSEYKLYNELANAALDDSFRSDPYWGTAKRDLMVLKPLRTLANPEVNVDPYAAEIIDYNPLEPAISALPGVMAAMVLRHQIAPIPWPKDLEPKIDKTFTFRGPGAELPKADFVFITWTSAEANAMAAVMTPGHWAMPATNSSDPGWYKYTNQWDARYRGRSFGKAPAATQHYIGKYMPIRIKNRRVLLFKSNFHLARDDKSMPVKDMFKQIIRQTEARLVITSGTAGAIGAKLRLGDVVIANTARFHCGRTFKKSPFNGKRFTSNFKPSGTTYLDLVNKKLVEANAGQLSSQRKGNPKVYELTAPKGSLPADIVTTDEFEYDDTKNKFHLQGKGAMVEMDDAVLGLACEEMQTPTKWLAIRNASDEQMRSTNSGAAADIYKQYGYWTSIPSALACWACVLDY